MRLEELTGAVYRRKCLSPTALVQLWTQGIVFEGAESVPGAHTFSFVPLVCLFTYYFHHLEVSGS